MALSIAQWRPDEARKEDIDAVVRIVRLSMARKRPPEEPSVEEGTTMLKRWFAIPDTGALVARSFLSKRVDGVLIFRDEPPKVRIIYAGVRDSRQGVGTTMLEMLEQFGTAHGWESVQVTLNPKDPVQHGFFIKKHGFTILGETEIMGGVEHYDAERSFRGQAKVQADAAARIDAADGATSAPGTAEEEPAQEEAPPQPTKPDRAGPSQEATEKALGMKLLAQLKAVHEAATGSWEDPKKGFTEIAKMTKATARTCRSVNECLAQLDKERKARRSLMAQMSGDRSARGMLASRLAAEGTARAAAEARLEELRSELEAEIAEEKAKREAVEAEFLQTKSDLEADLALT
ncbi:GNAT family N-acetyltransferase, partial [Planctomycetota bacterium]